jgi:hypothetical protein
MKIESTGLQPAGVESIQAAHLRHLKPGTHPRQEEQAVPPQQRENLGSRLEPGRIQDEKDRLNFFGMEIRSADRSLAVAETLLDRIFGEMQQVVKQYPPFPPGSEERVERLKTITALRKEIDQLTVPPVEKPWPETLSMFGIPEEAEDADSGKSLKKTPREIPLEIPTLDRNATDEEIQDTADAVRKSINALRKRRRDVRSDAEHFFRHEIRSNRWDRFVEGMSAVDTALLAEKAAGLAASAMHDLQARDGVRSLTLDASPLTDFLG